jgi:hypothetical protein
VTVGQLTIIWAEKTPEFHSISQPTELDFSRPFFPFHTHAVSTDEQIRKPHPTEKKVVWECQGLHMKSLKRHYLFKRIEFS